MTSRLPAPAAAWPWQNSHSAYCLLLCPVQEAPASMPIATTRFFS